MRASFADRLRCPQCQAGYRLLAGSRRDPIREGVLECACGSKVPIIDGVPRILPDAAAGTLRSDHPEYYGRHPELSPETAADEATPPNRTLRAFGDEWRRFPELLPVHEEIFAWYFEGPAAVDWRGRTVLDAGCGMGRWLHFARKAGAEVVGMDVSPAVDVATAREGDEVDFVQADLLSPPFAPGSFDLVYSLGVIHHLQDPQAGVRALARLVRPGGELRLYVYRTLAEEPLWRRALLGTATLLRRVTTRLPYGAVHGVAVAVSLVASVLFLWPRRLVRRWSRGEHLTRGLPLAHYTDVPFRMLVAEQFDRLVAPIEGRFRKQDVEAWLLDVGFEALAVLPGLGWRAIGRRPAAE